MTRNAIQRFLSPDRNVGSGDLVSRVMAVAILALGLVLVLPQAVAPYRLVKIALLISAEAGLVLLMLGMFLNSKTYFAGLQLFVGPLSMLGLLSTESAYSAAVVGALFVVHGLAEIFTRRSRLNALFGLSSFDHTVDGSLLSEALRPETSPPVHPQINHPQPSTARP